MRAVELAQIIQVIEDGLKSPAGWSGQKMSVQLYPGEWQRLAEVLSKLEVKP